MTTATQFAAAQWPCAHTSLKWDIVSRESGSKAPCIIRRVLGWLGFHLHAPENLTEARLDLNNRRSAFGASTAFSGLIHSSVVFSFFASIKSRILRTKTGLQAVCALLSAGIAKKSTLTALQSSSERLKNWSNRHLEVFA